LKKLVGNTEMEDRLRKLDRLTQEEARMAAAENMRITRSVEGKVMGVDDKVKDIDEGVQYVRSGVEDVGKKVQGVDDKVEGIGKRVQGVDDRVEDVGKSVQDVDERIQSVGERVQDKVQDINHKLDQANRPSSPTHSPLLTIQVLQISHRKPAPR